MRRKVKVFGLLAILVLMGQRVWGQQFYGIGVKLSMDNTLPTPLPYIQSVVEGSAADKAGIKAGWHLYSVDRELLSGKTIDQITNLIRGAEGTAVTIQIIMDPKANSKSYKTYKLTRGPIGTSDNPALPLHQQFGDSTIREFYTRCKDIAKRITDDGYIITYDKAYDNCRNRYIKFIAEAGVEYRVRLLTMGKKGFTAKAVVWSDYDSNHPIQLTQSDYNEGMLKFETRLTPTQTTPYTILFDDNDKGESECRAFYVMIIK